MDRKLRRRLLFLIFTLAAASGVYMFPVFQSSVLAMHNINWKLIVAIDFYGAVIPAMVSIIIFFCLVMFKRFPLGRYLRYLLISFVLAIVFSGVTATAVVSHYILFDLSISFLTVFLVFYGGRLSEFIRNRDLRRFRFTTRDYINGLLIASSYASLSILMVDLAYAPLAISMYIGALGLTDGILLSGLLAPLTMTFATLFMMFVCEMQEEQHANIAGPRPEN